jgi:hypothetical protein
MTPDQARSADIPDLSGYPAEMKKKHLAELLGCSVRAIELRLKAGTFPIPRLARALRPRFSKADVQRYFQSKTFASTDQAAAPQKRTA